MKPFSLASVLACLLVWGALGQGQPVPPSSGSGGTSGSVTNASTNTWGIIMEDGDSIREKVEAADAVNAAALAANATDDDRQDRNILTLQKDQLITSLAGTLLGPRTAGDGDDFLSVYSLDGNAGSNWTLNTSAGAVEVRGVQSDLVARWHFDEASYDGTPGEAEDDIGSYSATRVGDADTTPASFLGSACYTGDTTAALALDSDLILADDTAWSVFGWVYTSGNTRGVYGHDFAAGNYTRWLVYASDGKILLANDANNQLSTANGSFPLSADTWEHIGLTCDGSDSDNIIAWLNGSGVATGTLADSSQHITALGCVDDDASNFGINGMLDELAFYDSALTQSEITSLYNGGSGTVDDPTETNGGNASIQTTNGWVTADTNDSIATIGMTYHTVSGATPTGDVSVLGYYSQDGGIVWSNVPLSNLGSNQIVGSVGMGSATNTGDARLRWETRQNLNVDITGHVLGTLEGGSL